MFYSIEIRGKEKAKELSHCTRPGHPAPGINVKYYTLPKEKSIGLLSEKAGDNLNVSKKLLTQSPKRRKKN